VPIHFRCPHCDKLLAIGTRKGGTRIPCPLCDRLVTVPPRTEVQLPTTTVAPPEVGQAWWLDAPVPVPPPPKESGGEPPPPSPPDAWWVTAPAPPPSSVAADIPPPPEPPPPEPPAEPLLLEAPLPAKTKPIRSFPLGIILIVAASALLAALGLALLVLSQPTPPSSGAPPSPPHEEKSSALPDKGKVEPRRTATEEELRREAATFPEIALDRGDDRTEAQRLHLLAATAAREGKSLDVVLQRISQRPDLAGLPLRLGYESRLSADAADRLHQAALALRSQLFAVTQAGVAPLQAKLLRNALNAEGSSQKWLRPEALPALRQLLMAEGASIREVLVERVARIADRRASAELAHLALYDLDDAVRRAAVSALAQRPHEDYRQILVDGFRYPWSAVADHAAAALVALDLRETTSALRKFLEQAEPQAAFKKPGKDALYVREVVRLNHWHNCLLCHAPSLSERDKPRGFVPPTDQAPPPSFTREYYAARRPGLFVRADTTYLRQDFSVPLPVTNPGKWPEVQRFDFLVRERPAADAEIKAARPAETNSYRRALLFALRELSGETP
jgi:phage FluMu protein Com